jgi:hypothetical protein
MVRKVKTAEKIVEAIMGFRNDAALPVLVFFNSTFDRESLKIIISLPTLEHE